MNEFMCPDCGRRHDSPIDASFVVAVLCDDCDLTIALERVARERALDATSRGRADIAA